MRISNLAAGLLLSVVSISAFAEDSPRKDINLGASFGTQGFALRRLISENDLLFIGVGYGKSMFDISNGYGASTSSSNINSNNYYATAGVRHYLSNEKLSSFIELELTGGHNSGTSSSSSGTPSDSSGNSKSAILGYGLEYFLDTHFSVEARAGVEYGYSKSSSFYGNSGSDSYTSKNINIPTVDIAITRYW